MTIITIKHILLSGLAIAMLTGCPSEDKGTPTGSAKADSSTKAAGESDDGKDLSDEQVDAEEIPTQEDFEEQVEKEITEENYLDELDKLAGEIEGDKG